MAERVAYYSSVERVVYTLTQHEIECAAKGFVCELFKAKFSKGQWSMDWYDDDDSGGLVVELTQTFEHAVDGVAAKLVDSGVEYRTEEE